MGSSRGGVKVRGPGRGSRSGKGSRLWSGGPGRGSRSGEGTRSGVNVVGSRSGS